MPGRERAASGPRTVNAVRTSGGVLLTQLFQRFSQDRHRPPGIGDFVRRQKLDQFGLTALFGLFCIQAYKFLVLMARVTPGPLGRTSQEHGIMF
jgi:hypothetical protein